jgi:hypothetical protein
VSRRRNASQHVSLARHNNDTFVLQPPRSGERLAKDRGKAASVYQLAHNDGKAASAPVHDRLTDNRDMHDTLNSRRHRREEQRREVVHHYNPCHSSHYDSGEDRSWSPPPPGP